ncbi:MAG TPA: hypothetical protein VF028_03090 [Actinomycetota bacterium]|nr:hypothetical protein [Actinomycetota bacterium]
MRRRASTRILRVLVVALMDTDGALALELAGIAAAGLPTSR